MDNVRYRFVKVDYREEKWLLLSNPDHPNAPQQQNVSENGMTHMSGGLIKLREFEPKSDAEVATSYFYNIISPYDPDGPGHIEPVSENFVKCMGKLLKSPVTDIFFGTKFFLDRFNPRLKDGAFDCSEFDEYGARVKTMGVGIIAPTNLIGRAVSSLQYLARNQRFSIEAGDTFEHAMAWDRYRFSTMNGAAQSMINESVFRLTGPLSSVRGFMDINNAIIYFTDETMYARVRRILGLDSEPPRPARTPQAPKGDILLPSGG